MGRIIAVVQCQGQHLLSRAAPGPVRPVASVKLPGVSARDLTVMGATLANGGVNPVTSAPAALYHPEAFPGPLMGAALQEDRFAVAVAGPVKRGDRRAGGGLRDSAPYLGVAMSPPDELD
jgi:hypothetical protein